LRIESQGSMRKLEMGGRMAIIRSFRDLDVYALGREQAKTIFVISKAFPKEGEVFAYGSDTALVASS
jgi:hypothetical protein